VDARRTRDALLVVLTVATGAVDAVSWLAFDKVFSAFMTGNIVLLGFGVAGAAGPPVLRSAASLVGFGTGAALGGRIVSPDGSEEAWPRRVTTALAFVVLVEAAFLAVWVVVDARPSSATATALIAVSALAMGTQTVAIFSLGVRAVFTTAATATWAALMGDLSDWARSRKERRRLGLVLAGLFAGAVAGGLLIDNAPTWAPVLPLGLTAGVVVVAALRFGHELSPRAQHGLASNRSADPAAVTPPGGRSSRPSSA
jgi:uncharacterized membrane protein YoaK (UPF0700 family)